MQGLEHIFFLMESNDLGGVKIFEKINNCARSFFCEVWHRNTPLSVVDKLLLVKHQVDVTGLDVCM